MQVVRINVPPFNELVSTDKKCGRNVDIVPMGGIHFGLGHLMGGVELSQRVRIRRDKAAVRLTTITVCVT